MPLSPSLDTHSTGVIDNPFILKLQGITKYYYSQTVPAVNNVSLNLKHGDILGLLGPSGCGKTTLLRFIAGFEKTQSGSLWVGDLLVAGPQVWAAPEERDIGMVFQDFALFPHLSVFENIAFGLKTLFHRKADLKQRVMEVLELVGLTGLQHRYPHELSGGQQQRIALARAIAPKPKLVLLDEPLSNLDVQVRLHLRQELRAILKAAKTSAIFVTHDQEEALAISDRVAVMRCGELEQVGSPEEIYSTPASKFVAEFVTQANFLNAERHGQAWTTELGSFDAWVSGESREHPNQRGWLMIRQEDMLLKPDRQGRAIILDHQFLGREYRYRLRTPSGQTLYALSKSTEGLAKGVTVSITAKAQPLQIFPQEAKTYG
jgi:iron(III) transport system ATP-binding protein